MKGVAPSDNPVLQEALKDSGVKVVTQDELSTVSKIALQLAQAKKRLASLQEQVEEETNEIKRLEERELPAAMADMGMKDFTLSDGSKIVVNKHYHAGVKVEDRPAAFKWLRTTNNESLIKAELQIPFAKGDVESASMLQKAIEELLKKRRERLEKQLEEAREAGDDETAARLTREIAAFNVDISLDQSVHWQTLRAFVKEQIIEEERKIEAGELDPEKDKDKLFPRELFGVYIFDKAEVLPPPKTKGKKK